MGKLDDIFFGKSYDGDDDGAAIFAEGKVKSITDKGITFTVPTFDDSAYVWGPSPYGSWVAQPALSGAEEHTHTMVGPQVGDRCLVLFPTGTTIDPWVIGWWPS